MTSRLSSLLVRDGVVAVRRMEKAFQRQVLFGGGLDTILLEMNELTEQRLLQYLSLSTGLPPATARELEGMDKSAAARCSRALAERFGVVPLSFDGDALRILTRDPVDLGALEDLATELGTAVQPFVAPEFRYELAFDRAYGRTSEDRFARLAEASKLSAIPPVGRSPAVVVEAAAPPPGSAPAAAPSSAPAAAPSSAPAAAPSSTPAAAPSSTPAAAPSSTPAAAPSSTPAAAQPAAPATSNPSESSVLLSAAVDAAVTAAMSEDDEGAVSAGAIGRQTLEMTADAVRQRREETERQAAEAYRRHAAPPAEPADLEGAPVVVIEYETSDASSLAVTLPLARPAEDGRVAGVISGEIGLARAVSPVRGAAADSGPVPAAPLGGGDSGAAPNAPLVMGDSAAVPTAPLAGGDTSAVPTAPLASGDSAATVQPFRRMARFDPTPITIGEARALLSRAENRDQVFEILLRAVRARTWYVALLTVQGGAAIGRVAIAGGEVDQGDITHVLIPLDAPSAFRQTVNTASPYIGPIATGDNQIDEMIRRLGGVVPPSAVLMPLVLRNRVVAILIGHRGADMLRVTEVSELLPLAAPASDALGRIIRRGKQSRQMAAVASVPETADDAAPTTRMPAMVVVDDAAASPGAAVVPPEIEALMAAVQGVNGNEEAAADAMREALGRAPDVLPWVRAHFPGELLVDRAQLGGRRLRPAQHGPLLDFIVRLGQVGADLVIAKMRDSRPDVRYYAVLCAAEMRLPAMMAPLVEAVFEGERATRELAIEGLSGYPAAALSDALEVVRRALRGTDTRRVEAAADALAGLADERAIPELLDAHGRGGEAAHGVGLALVSLTKQDFGPSNRKWRQWWDKNRRKSRVEWLLEGLAHKDTEIRRTSVDELRKQTGEYFGYHPDLPRREREQARQRWLDWWNQTGRHHFHAVEEHDRPRPAEQQPPARP